MVAFEEKAVPLMVNKTFIPEGEAVASQIGATLEALAATIAARRDADEASYTYRLLTGNVDDVLKKVMEESGEVALAAKDVEGWATSSLAAAVALEAASAGAGDAASDVEAADEGAGAPLSSSCPRSTARRSIICATRPPMWCIIFSSCWSATASRLTSSLPS